MLDALQVWAGLLWPSVQNDLAFVAIGGIIVIAAQLVNGAFGVWKNVGVKEEAFDTKHFIYTLIREIGLVALLAAVIVILHMLGNLAGLSIIPSFEMGDLPTIGLLVAFGTDVYDKAKNTWNNLLVIYNKED